MEITESNECTVIKESTGNFCEYLWYRCVFVFNFHEWINEWAVIAFEIQCASLSIMYFPFPFLFTCELLSLLIRILISTKDEAKENKNIARLFCLLFFIVSSLLASKMLVSFIWKNHNVKKETRTTEKKYLVGGKFMNVWIVLQWQVIYHGNLKRTKNITNEGEKTKGKTQNNSHAFLEPLVII